MRQALLVVVGITHFGDAVARLARHHSERPAAHRRHEGELTRVDRLRAHLAQHVRRQRHVLVGPNRDEGRVRSLEVEGDALPVAGDRGALDLVESHRGTDDQILVEPEAPRVVDVARIERLPVGPLQTRTQMEGVGPAVPGGA